MNATHRFHCHGCQTLLQIPLELLPASGPCPTCGLHLEAGTQELKPPVRLAPAPEPPAVPAVEEEVAEPCVRRRGMQPVSAEQVRSVLVASIIVAFTISGGVMSWWTADAWHSAGREAVLAAEPLTVQPAVTEAAPLQIAAVPGK